MKIQSILFMGKSIDPEYRPGSLVFGYFWKELDDRCFIGVDMGTVIQGEEYRTLVLVDPESLSIYLGEKDAYGDRVFTQKLPRKHRPKKERKWKTNESLG